jgi:hypothetical protein
MSRNDTDYLRSLAEYRMLTARQLAAIHGKNVQALRRRLRFLQEQKLLEIRQRSFGKGRGRPEDLICLSKRGIQHLKDKGVLFPSLPLDAVAAEQIHCVDHQLLVNDFRTHLAELERSISPLSVRFLSPLSPLILKPPHNRNPVWERFQWGHNPDDEIRFIPDGVFCLSHAESKKDLLLFLEVDMGTETLASPKRSAKDVRQKVINYQYYFRLRKYKRYEEIWNCSLRGFRLLFLAHTTTRFGALCQLVRAIPPSSFIWLTDRDRLNAEGLGSAVWAPGGRTETPRQSILGV